MAISSSSRGRIKAVPRLLGATLAAAMAVLAWINPIFLEDFRQRTFDVFLRQAPTTPGPTPIYIVDIDSKSLAALGQWPWPRTIMAETLRLIAADKPKAVGLDIVYAEPDRSSPAQIAALLAEQEVPAELLSHLQALPDHDQLLAQTLLTTPTVLGYTFAFGSGGSESRPLHQEGWLATKGFDPLPFLFSAPHVDANLPLLEQSAMASGFFNVLPDADGIVRRVPLIMEFEGKVYPSLMLEMLRTSQSMPTVIMTSAWKGDEITGVESLKVGEPIIPTDANGQLNIRFCGPERSLPYVSVIDILTGETPPGTFTDAFVLVGTSAPGLRDIRATPTSADFPGVEIHGHALNTILTSSYIRRPDWARMAEITYLLAVSGILIFLLPRIGAIKSGLLATGFSGGLAFVSYWAFVRHGFLVDLVYPLLTVALLFTVLTFTNYVYEEREKRQVRGAFSRYLSPVLVGELLQHPERLTLSGEEREMTILFSDIRGFTSISEKMNAQELCHFINEYLTPMTQEILDQRGTVDKFIGDAIMAFWNAPLDDEAHALNGCRVGLAMQRRLVDLNRNWQANSMPPIAIGIGLHTGQARVGNMGSEQRFDYTVMGDTVNLTSRLESITKRYGAGIIVSEFTWAKVQGNGFVFRQLDRVRVKGKQEPVTIYELLEEQDRLSDATRAELAGYEQALALYYGRDFAAAGERFAELGRRQPQSPLYKLYIEQCRLYALEPPPTDWDGVTTLTSK